MAVHAPRGYGPGQFPSLFRCILFTRGRWPPFKQHNHDIVHVRVDVTVRTSSNSLSGTLVANHTSTKGSGREFSVVPVNGY